MFKLRGTVDFLWEDIEDPVIGELQEETNCSVKQIYIISPSGEKFKAHEASYEAEVGLD